jgi:hypothetical protein
METDAGVVVYKRNRYGNFPRGQACGGLTFFPVQSTRSPSALGERRTDEYPGIHAWALTLSLFLSLTSADRNTTTMSSPGSDGSSSDDLQLIHRTLVGSAIRSGANAVAALSLFHKRGIDIGACYTGNGFPIDNSMMYAAYLGHVEVIKLLHELRTANVNATDAEGRAPVHVAAISGSVDAILTLCELGVDCNTLEKKGRTPVFGAAQEGHVEAIRTLCELGADMNTPSKYGSTPLFTMGRSRLFVYSASWVPIPTPPARRAGLLCM